MDQKELARRLKLSQTTVSRALAGYADVSEATRLMVQKAAADLGYRPNSSARRLATGRAGSIGFVFPVERNMLIDPHFLEFLAGVSETLGGQSIDIVLSPTTLAEESATYDRLAREGSVDGIVIAGTEIADERVAHLVQLGFPFITHGRTKEGPEHAYLDIDNEGGFRRATALLTDFGHRRIGLINGQPNRNYADDRQRGYAAALADKGLPVDPDLIVAAPMTVESGYTATRALLTRTPRPTALLCGSTVVALGAMQALAEEKLELGRDVSIIAHDDGLPSVRADLIGLPLTTTYSPIRPAGARAAEMLLSLIAGTPAEDLQEVLPVELIMRASTGPAPDA